MDRLGFEPSRSGFIKCPGHDETNPSLKIYPNSDSFYCFSCGTGGTVIDFYMLYASCDFKTAVESLAGMYGISKELTLADKKLRVRERRRPKQDDEYEYWCKEFFKYLDVLRQKHTDWTPELEEACQKIAYAEYRMDVANERRKNNLL